MILSRSSFSVSFRQLSSSSRRTTSRGSVAAVSVVSRHHHHHHHHHHVLADDRRIKPRNYNYNNCVLQPPTGSSLSANRVLSHHHRTFSLSSKSPTEIIMADNNDANGTTATTTTSAEGNTQTNNVSVDDGAVSTMDQDYVPLDGKKNEDNDNGQDDNNDNNNDQKDQSKTNQNGNSKQRKAARWKQLNKKRKDGRRQKFAKEGEEDDDNDENKNKKAKKNQNDWKKDYDAAKLPHSGSFANETMQKLFGVDIDAPSSPSGGEEKKGEGDNAATTANKPDGSVDVTAAATENENVKKVPKRKLALLASFLGSNYIGFQINDEKRTLHAEIELALYRSGIISKMNFGYPSKYSWSNSARTDKGVHAAAQVCSLKGEMIFHHKDDLLDDERGQLDAMRLKVNSHLPSDVRVLDFVKVTGKFCARTSRDKVRYQYMVPSFMLCSREEVQAAFSAKEKDGETNTESPEEDAIDPEVLKKAGEILLQHRATPEQMERLKRGLKLFEGTHSFHNYTRRVGADNASATRYILSFEPLDPILVPGGGANDDDDDGTPKQPDQQWIPLQVVGQSFLLNQIRKMVSGAVDHARGAVSEEKIVESFSKQSRMKVNVAPAQGLFLDRSYFELYNKIKVKNGQKHGGTLERSELDWVEVEGEDMPAAVRRIEEFKNEKIIPHIIDEETKESNFLKFMYSQDVLCKHGMYGPIDDGNKKWSTNKKDSAGAAGK